MSQTFQIDEQTYQDLQIVSKNGISVIDYFDKTITDGGKEELYAIFRSPSTDLSVIEERQATTQWCLANNKMFPFDAQLIKDIAKYWSSSHDLPQAENHWMDRFYFWRKYNANFYYRSRDIADTLLVIERLNAWLYVNSEKQNVPTRFQESAVHAREVYKRLSAFAKNGSKIAIQIGNIDSLDRIIRVELRQQLSDILQLIYEIDAFCSIAQAAKTNGLTFPELKPKAQQHAMEIVGLYHLFKPDSVRNDFIFSADKNKWLLTGANMAGKSTFIKALSTVVFLAHAGLPVPAEKITLPVIDGLFTTINIPDDLHAGYSQFYQEAVRLREIFSQLKSDSNALIVFDELFKGTNYQDTFDASSEVIRQLKNIPDPYVILSSHIIELTDQFDGANQFVAKCMQTDIDEEGFPHFTYRLTNGVAKEKLGMWLLKRSGLFEEMSAKSSEQQ